MSGKFRLAGPRYVLERGCEQFPKQLDEIPSPPEKLYVIGNTEALQQGLAVIGARRATPYGRGCARRFARLAAEKGIVIISGGARGCDSEAHRAALDAGMPTVVFLGGGCNCIYPTEHAGLFQSIIDAGGAIVSEQPWDYKPLPYTFRLRNRLIAGLAKAVLIVEAGLPSGTFSTADEALAAGRDVLVVPGAITSSTSRGANRLMYQGARPVVDDESFEDALFDIFGQLKYSLLGKEQEEVENPVVRALLAEPLPLDELYKIAESVYGENARSKLMELLVEAEATGIIARQPDGRWGPKVAER
ncbi:MAG: DNA-processing protein DprA [Eggerthellaceae bacterium]|nr:DNA-processing protein DprA [Eggerthellaceae bacterium]